MAAALTLLVFVVSSLTSERLGASGSKGVTRSETGAINKSLFCLGKVIAALSRGGEVLASSPRRQGRWAPAKSLRRRRKVAKRHLKSTYGVSGARATPQPMTTRARSAAGVYQATVNACLSL